MGPVAYDSPSSVRPSRSGLDPVLDRLPVGPTVHCLDSDESVRVSRLAVPGAARNKLETTSQRFCPRFSPRARGAHGHEYWLMRLGSRHAARKWRPDDAKYRSETVGPSGPCRRPGACRADDRRRAPRARPGVGAARAEDRSRRGDFAGGRARRDRVGRRASLHPAELDARRQRRQHSRAGDGAVARGPSAQCEGSRSS